MPIAGSTVRVNDQPMTVLRYLPSDNKYLLETRDGFNTRRYYDRSLVTAIAPCGDKNCPCESGEPCSFV